MAAPDDATLVYERRLYEDRWSAFGASAGLLKLSDQLSPKDLQRFDLFKPYKEKLLERLTPDVSVARWQKGSVLFEEGSYLDLAFFIVEGSVEVFLRKHQDTATPIFHSGAPGAGAVAGDGGATVFQPAAPVQAAAAKKADEVTYLASMDFDLGHGEKQVLRAGDVFGEIGALNGWPQSATARAATDCTLVQIRLPALRLMKQKSKALQERLDALYRERTLINQLQTTPLFRGTDDRFIDQLADQVTLRSCEPGEVVTTEGDAVDTLYLVRSGFLKLSSRLGEGDVTMSYLSKGMTLGETELLLDGLDAWQFTTTSVGFTELVAIPREDFLEVVGRYPAIERRLWEATVARIKDAGQTRRQPEKADLVDFALMKGLVQGNSILVMDLDVCTRCDDCVRGCADTHGGRPRFVREGEKYQNFLIARSCYHCEDPVCLIGCPTGAIQRANVGEVVKVEDSICIGCGNCAEKCPYDAIVMHDTGTTWPEHATPKHLRGQERRVASKCDLCHTSSHGPACVNNCPHACAFRIDSVEAFQELLSADRGQA